MATQTTETFPATLRLGPAHLAVTSIERALPFYEGVVGLPVRRREAGRVALGAGDEDVVVLHEEPDARPAGRHAGLYHVAVLYPSREELAHAALRIALSRTPITGASDHRTHEAIYLPDPDGNELELAADRPREAWPDFASDPYAAGPHPLDLDGLLRAAGTREPRPYAAPDTVVGHVHLYVGDVEEAVRFYTALGFDEMMRMPTATFLSAGGYHHHLAANVWRGVGIPPAPDDVVGLRRWTIVLPDEAAVGAALERLRGAGYAVEGPFIRDPWNIPLLLTT